MAQHAEPLRLRHTIQAVKDLIQSQGLRPGDPLPTENDLVERLEVSRSSLREAVRTLAALDILQVRHGVGTFVGELSLRPLVEGLVFKGTLLPGTDFESLRQVVAVRKALDHAMAEALISNDHHSPAEGSAELTDLAQLCQQMADQMAKKQSFTEADRCFHLQLAQVTGNELYGQLVAAFWDVHAAVAPKLNVPTPKDLQDTVDAHRLMLEAVAERDLAAYHEAVEAHYAPLLRVLAQAAA